MHFLNFQLAYEALLSSFFCFLTAVVLLYYCKRCSDKKSPPGPWGIPVLGYYAFMRENVMQTTNTLTKKYGPIFGINLLGKKAYFLNDVATVHEIFIKNWNKTINRPQNYSVWSHVMLKNSIAFGSGNNWKFHRGIMLRNLFPGPRNPSVEAKTMEACEKLVDRLDSRADSVFDIFDLLVHFDIDVTSSLLYNKTYHPDDPEYLELKYLCHWFFTWIPYVDGNISGPTFHVLTLLNFRKYWSLTQIRKRVLRFFRPLVQERFRILNSGEDEDILSRYAKLSSDDLKKHQDVSMECDTICFALFNMLLGGAETITQAFYYAIYLMILHPDVQNRVQEEIEQIVGSRPITLEDKINLHYTNAVLNEVLRYSCVVPYGTVREASSDIYVNGFVIEKGAALLLNITGLSRDPSHFSRPNEFYPEHFLGQDGRFRKNEAHIPFGIGARQCVAYKLSEAVLFLAFGTLMQKFHWCCSDDDHSFKSFVNFTRSLQRFELKIIQRR